MQTMPTLLHGHPERCADILAGGRLTYAAAGHLERCLDILVGGHLTADEHDFVNRLAAHGWTIRVIIDGLRERRGMVEVPLDFDWRSLKKPLPPAEQG